MARFRNLAVDVDVLIESAYFDPDSERRRPEPGMDIEASRRFERGVDYGSTQRAAALRRTDREIAGGTATENVVDAQKEILRSAW